MRGLDERAISRITGCTLEAGAGPNLNVNDLQRYTQLITDRLAVFRPRISHSLEAVMNVYGVEIGEDFGFCEISEKVQQDGGIKAAAESDAPGRGVAPRFQIQQKPGRQINRGPIHIFPFAQIKCGSEPARDSGTTANKFVEC
ncbi:hypothetical protein EMIT0P171_60083 [Pseudomonas sp. IT-P171]